jgi:hypothetical protein
MVYGFAKESGGEFLLRSVLGKGTTASIFLPTLPFTGEQSPVQATPRDLPRGTETILVVEDESRVRHLAKRSLIDLVPLATSSARKYERFAKHIMYSF